ncbi:hypothetical protein ASG63_08905 [Methylobacterium sp. Leaf94]|uniref:hypothetical protein n=1 Tax=Methylobacterium sp. Leaf94 TaxID=1736250 RepID=UPI0006F7BE5C|nr:hypothetical protein [Methylobacterium sp. Leaf94]KQU17615.1 hypothetical protein ASG63_08905 [Methylobacterium sp. Leaf94]
MRRLLSAAFVAAACVPLGACPDAKPDLAAPAPVIVRRVEVLIPKVPTRFRHCRNEPEILGEDATQGDVAPAYVDALAAGQDCRRKLATVDALLASAERRSKGSAR